MRVLSLRCGPLGERHVRLTKDCCPFGRRWRVSFAFGEGRCKVVPSCSWSAHNGLDSTRSFNKEAGQGECWRIGVLRISRWVLEDCVVLIDFFLFQIFAGLFLSIRESTKRWRSIRLKRFFNYNVRVRATISFPHILSAAGRGLLYTQNTQMWSQKLPLNFTVLVSLHDLRVLTCWSLLSNTRCSAPHCRLD